MWAHNKLTLQTINWLVLQVSHHHTGSRGLTSFDASGTCSPGTPYSPYQAKQVNTQAAMADVVSMQTDIEAQWTCTAAFENKLHSSDYEMLNMKCMIQNMVETMQVMQHMKSNGSSSSVVPESQVNEKPTKWSYKESSTESVDRYGLGQVWIATSLRRGVKRSGLKSYEVQAQDLILSPVILVILSAWPHPKGLGQVNNMHVILISLTLLGERWKAWFTCFDDVATRKGWDDKKYLDILLPKLQGQDGDCVFDEFSPNKHYKLHKCLLSVWSIDSVK